MSGTALLTFSIGPVHTFIGQARRVADLWSGSQILSDLARSAIDALPQAGQELVFPKATPDTQGLPNRFVARVDADRANETAATIQAAVEKKWRTIVEHGVSELASVHFPVSALERDGLWNQTIHCSWSWITETGSYKDDSRAAAELYAASRVYREFDQRGEAGMKCAICGERNALPNGDRTTVTEAWSKAESNAKGTDLEPFLRGDQTRLCLVCTAKRFYPTFDRKKDGRAIFRSFESFQPEDDRAYFALVSMDGDRLGEALGNADEMEQARISAALSDFAGSLRTANSAALNLKTLGIAWPPGETRTPPQLIYAGGEDVLFVADPRDALACATAIRKRYGRAVAARGLDPEKFTISAAVTFAHTKIPAGRLLADTEDLLKRRAKATRNAIALALHKRSGPGAETAFPWEGDVTIEILAALVEELREGNLASRQTYDLSDESRILTEVLESDEQWKGWLEWRLTKGGGSRAHVERLATLLAPLFRREQRRVEALRIARFLAIELESRTQPSAAKKLGGAA